MIEIELKFSIDDLKTIKDKIALDEYPIPHMTFYGYQ